MKTYQELNLKFKNLSDIEILEIFKNITLMILNASITLFVLLRVIVKRRSTVS
jgi:hypothetical protein